MSRRTRASQPGRVALVVLAAASVLAASCSDTSAIAQRSGTTRSSTSTTTAEETATSTTAPPTTAPPTTAPPVPETPATQPPATEPAPPGEGYVPGDPGVAPPETVRPPAAWLGFGVPAPGSMFENLRDDRSLDGRGPVVGLTFDDGPSQYTGPIVNILRYLGVQATFFQISSQAAKRPEVVQQMAAAGMRIGAHSRTHPHLRDLDPAAQADQVLGSIDDLANIAGPGIVKCFRPPYANYDQHVIDLVASRNAAVAMWSYDTLDWKKPSWTSLAERVVREAQDRQVILMHDGGGDRTATIQALPWIILGLRQRGFTIIPVC